LNIVTLYWDNKIAGQLLNDRCNFLDLFVIILIAEHQVEHAAQSNITLHNHLVWMAVIHDSHVRVCVNIDTEPANISIIPFFVLNLCLLVGLGKLKESIKLNRKGISALVEGDD